MSQLLTVQVSKHSIPETHGTYALLESLGVEVKRVRGQSFWEANEFELDFIYAEFCRVVRNRLRDLHPDCGGDGYEFGRFRAATQRLKFSFEKKGFGRDMTLHRALINQERFELMKAARTRGPIFRHQDIQETDLGLWHSGVFDRVVSAEPVFQLPRNIRLQSQYWEARRLFVAGHSCSEVVTLTGISQTTSRRVRKTLTAIPNCECGRLAGHSGWCSVRFAKSERRKALLRSWALLPKQHARGADNGFAKLTEESAIKILNSTDGYRSLGRKFNVSHQAVSLLKRGVTWRHIR